MTTTSKAIGGVVIAFVGLLGVVFFARSSSGSGSPPQISVTDAYEAHGRGHGKALHDAAMAPEARLTVKGHSDTALVPGATHIMLEGLARPLQPGGQVGVRLLFERSAPVDMTAPVLSYDQVNAKAGDAVPRLPSPSIGVTDQ